MCIWKKLYWDGKCVLIWSILNKNKNFAILRCLSHQSYCLFLTNMKTTSVSENYFYFDRLPMNSLSGLSRIIVFVKVWNIAHTALQNYNRPNYKTNSELWKNTTYILYGTLKTVDRSHISCPWLWKIILIEWKVISLFEISPFKWNDLATFSYS